MAALLIAGLLVLQSSRATFLDTTTSSGNTIAAAVSFGPSVSILDAWTGELDFLANGMTFDPSAGTNRLVMIASTARTRA